MYIKECKWCNKKIEVEKQCLFALHVCNCDLNPNKKDYFLVVAGLFSDVYVRDWLWSMRFGDKVIQR